MFSQTMLAVGIMGAFVSFVGIICNLFLMTLSCRDPTDDFRQSPSNQIQFSLGLTNVFLQCILTITGLIYAFSPFTLASRELSPGLNLVTYFLTGLTCWLTAWLCSFYCVTIVRFKHNILTSLKMGLSDLVRKLLMVTALGTFCLALPSIWHAHTKVQKTGNITSNFSSKYVVVFNCSSGYGIVFITAGCLVPLVLTISSIIFTLGSLLRHVWRIKFGASSSSSPQLQAHFRACRTMILLLILYVIFNLTEIITVFFTTSTESVFTIVTWLLILMYPSAQSLIVISGSTKLKEAFCRIVLCTK